MPPFGFHLLPNSVGGDWLPWAATGAPDVKVCDAALIWPAQQLGARVFWRPCFLASDNGEGDCGDGAAWGANVIAQITSNGNHWPEMIGFRNEMNPTAANAAQYQRYRAVLRAAGYAGLVVYGSFGNGRPDWPEYATIPTDADALELHEYWTDTVAGSPDLALRHVEALRRGLISPTMTLYLGEIGDWKAGQGWQGNSTPAQMTEQLSIFRAGCAPSVVAAFVFADGNNGDPQWNSFTTRATPVEATIRVTWPTTPKGATVLSGIDVSSMQPGTDWQQVAQTHQFAFVKATESTGYVNPYFGRDWAGAKQNGLVRAAYDFAQPSFNSPEAEVDYLLSVVGVLDSTDNIALDLEVGNGDLRSWAERWVL
ncbi:MAG TPA: glycoside hydrolase family 25 protein, partial [Chloroflexota bacterium]